MKKTILLLGAIFFLFLAAFPQNSKKLVVMITRANWCPACRANEGKINNELVPAYAASGVVQVVINDVTNKRAKSKSEPMLQSAGVYKIAREEKATGVIALIDPATRKVIKHIYVSYSIPKIKEEIEEALAKL